MEKDCTALTSNSLTWLLNSTNFWLILDSRPNMLQFDWFRWCQYTECWRLKLRQWVHLPLSLPVEKSESGVEEPPRLRQHPLLVNSKEEVWGRSGLEGHAHLLPCPGPHKEVARAPRQTTGTEKRKGEPGSSPQTDWVNPSGLSKPQTLGAQSLNWYEPPSWLADPRRLCLWGLMAEGLGGALEFRQYVDMCRVLIFTTTQDYSKSTWCPHEGGVPERIVNSRLQGHHGSRDSEGSAALFPHTVHVFDWLTGRGVHQNSDSFRGCHVLHLNTE